MPERHSLFWKLILGLALFCLLIVSMHLDLEQRVYDSMSTLSRDSRQELTAFGREAERAWRERGRSGLDEFLHDFYQREQVWVVAVDEHQQSLSSCPLSEEEALRLSFVRRLDQKVGRPGGQPVFYVPVSYTHLTLPTTPFV